MKIKASLSTEMTLERAKKYFDNVVWVQTRCSAVTNFFVHVSIGKSSNADELAHEMLENFNRDKGSFELISFLSHTATIDKVGIEKNIVNFEVFDAKRAEEVNQWEVPSNHNSVERTVFAKAPSFTPLKEVHYVVDKIIGYSWPRTDMR